MVPSNLRGGPLTERDYQALKARGIDREPAASSFARRVSSLEGAEILGRNGGGDYSGIAIPYVLPGENRVREWRVRRDNPEYENGKPKGKYMAPPGRGNLLYIPTGVEPDWLADVTLPLWITEGEFKAIALMEAARYGLGEAAARPRALPVALSGAWNWHGKIGKVVNEEGHRVDEKGPIPDLSRVVWKDRTATIIFDRDADSNDSVGIARNLLARELQTRGAIVKVFTWPDEHAEAKGIDDLIAAIGPEQVLKLIEKAKKRKPQAHVDMSGWHAGLQKSQTGEPKAVLANAMHALRESPEWEGVLQHDVFARRTFAAKPTPWGFAGKLDDHQDALACEWLHKQRIFVPRIVASEAVEAVARRNEVNPLKEYLDGLRWDEKPRIETWLRDYLGAEDSNYSRAIARKWLISAVARAYRPGVKADCVLILEGPQGAGKSTAFGILGRNWYTDEIDDLGSKDSSMQVAGVWIVELAELDCMSRPEVSKVKAFISRTTDRFRPPYGRRLVEAPRQCIFGGSVNTGTYLKDETGGRRFWPVKCGRINLDSLERDRDQIWAEAVKCFRLGASWWMDSPELTTAAEFEQEARQDSDPWQQMIANWAENPSEKCDPHGHPVASLSSTPVSVLMDDVLNHCVGKRPDMWTQVDKNRAGRCLRSLGFELRLKRDGLRREWRYLRNA